MKTLLRGASCFLALIFLAITAPVLAEESKAVSLKEIMADLRQAEVTCPILELVDANNGQRVKRDQPFIIKLKLDGDIITMIAEGAEERLKVGRFNFHQYAGENSSLNIDAINDFRNRKHFSSGRSAGMFGLVGVLIENAAVANTKKPNGNVLIRVTFNTDNQYSSICTD